MFAGLSRHTGASWEKLSPMFFCVSLSTVPKKKRYLTDILGQKDGLTERKNALESNWGVSEEEKAFRLLQSTLVFYIKRKKQQLLCLYIG